MFQKLINFQDLLESRGYVVDPIKTFSTGLNPKDRKPDNLASFNDTLNTWVGGKTWDTCDGPYWGDKPLPPFDRARIAMYKDQPPFDDKAFVEKVTSSTAMRTWNYKNTLCQVYDQSPRLNEVNSRNPILGDQERSFEVTTR